MLLHYDMPDGEDLPAPGRKVKISGDPDLPVLDGEVWRVDKEERLVAIQIEDGQQGAEELQQWVLSEEDIGVEFASMIILP